MEELPVVRLRDQKKEQTDNIFEDHKSFQRDPDSSTANLLVPPRPHSQRFHSHDNPVLSSQQSPTPRLWQFFWLLLTIVFSVLIFAIAKIYESRRNFTSVQKHMFNAITTALLLALGLNFFVSQHAHDLTIWAETDLSMDM